MIKRNTKTHVDSSDFPEEVQAAVQYVLEGYNNSGFSYEWIVYDDKDLDGRYEDQVQENIISKYLISQGFETNSVVYIDL